MNDSGAGGLVVCRGGRGNSASLTGRASAHRRRRGEPRRAPASAAGARSGGHDSDSRGVEGVLDPRVQVGGDQRSLHRVHHHRHQLVDGVEVLQPPLQDVGRRLGAKAGRRPGRLEQQRLDLTPGSVVTNAHPRVDQRPLTAGGSPEVLHPAVDHHRVGQGDLLSLQGEDVGGEQGHLGHHPLDLAHPNAVSAGQRAGVDHHQSAHRLRHHPARAEGDYQSQEQAQALEGIGARARQVRIGRGQGDQPHQGHRDAAGGPCGLGMHAGEAGRAQLHATEHPSDEARQRPPDEEDDHRGQQIRQGSDDAPSEARQQREHPAQQGIGPRPGQREER